MTHKNMLKRLQKGDDPLKVSIEKWKDIVAGTGKDLGRWNCALCNRFYADDCLFCPVRQRTDKPCCHGTPYEDWGQRKSMLYHSLIAAYRELDFLKSLKLKSLKKGRRT